MSKTIQLNKYVEASNFNTEDWFHWGTINDCRCYGIVLEKQTSDLTKYLNLKDYNTDFSEVKALGFPDDQVFIVQATSIDDKYDKMYIVFRYEDIKVWLLASDPVIPDGYKYDGFMRLSSSFKDYDSDTLNLLSKILVVFNKAGNGVTPVLIPVDEANIPDDCKDCMMFDMADPNDAVRDAHAIISNIEACLPAVNLETSPYDRFELVRIDDRYYIFNRNHQGYAGSKANIKVAMCCILNLIANYYDAIKEETVLTYYNGYIQSEENGVYVRTTAPVSALREVAATREDADISGNKINHGGKVNNLFDTIGLAKPE